MIDDLYSDRFAAADGPVLTGGTLVLAVADWVRLAPAVAAIGGALVTAGVVLFGTNLVLVLRRHSPHSVGRILLGTLDPRGVCRHPVRNPPSTSEGSAVSLPSPPHPRPKNGRRRDERRRGHRDSNDGVDRGPPPPVVTPDLERPSRPGGQVA